MAPSEPHFITVGEGADARKIAYLVQQGSSPGVLWLQGFMSDMVSTKATALSEWASRTGAALTRFDYTGHGQSGGQFEHGTVSIWLEDAEAVFDRIATGPQVLVGSSMGGYLAMLLQRKLAETDPAAAKRIKGILLIAPAWDMTETLMWQQFPEAVRTEIMNKGVWPRPSQYGDPYPITRNLIEDGRQHLFGEGAWAPDCPVRIIHGRLDPDVPFQHSEKLLEMMHGADVELIEVPDGEHRLSRPQDLALLIRTIQSMR